MRSAFIMIKSTSNSVIDENYLFRSIQYTPTEEISINNEYSDWATSKMQNEGIY